MILEIQIKNIGIIDKLDLQLNSGLNVMTGETGAGKSIILNSFKMLLGSKVKASEMIRSGQEEAQVKALFDIQKLDTIKTFLDEQGIVSCDSELIIQRKITNQGKGRCYINGEIVSQVQLKELGKKLTEIHSTFDQQQLLNKKFHEVYLDRYAKVKLSKKRYISAFLEWSNLKQKIDNLRKKNNSAIERKEILKVQLEELEFIYNLDSDKETLEKESLLIGQSTSIAQSLNNIIKLTEGDPNSIENKLKLLQSELEQLDDVDTEFSNYSKEFDTTLFCIQDLLEKSHALLNNLEANPRRLEHVDETLVKIRRLEKRYSTDFKGLKNNYQETLEELNELENPEDIEELDASLQNLEKKLQATARELQKERKKSARALKKEIEHNLSQLGMEKANFIVDFKEKSFCIDGIDDIEFLLTSNPGSKPLPLIKTASGGELCRIMLAFKVVFSKLDDIPVLIFDEIDANIGGETAVSAGDMLKNISQDKQIITITHQVPIAVKGDHHIAVKKIQSDEKTQSSIKLLNQEERIEEIARMLGGKSITSVVREHAREMLIHN